MTSAAAHFGFSSICRFAGIFLIGCSLILFSWQLYTYLTTGSWLVTPLCALTRFVTGTTSLSCPLNQPLGLYLMVTGIMLWLLGWGRRNHPPSKK